MALHERKSERLPPVAILPMPTESDSLPNLSSKLSSYLYVLHIGHCIATATGHFPGHPNPLSPEARIAHQMTPHERAYLEAWRTGRLRQLPEIDWEADRGHTPSAVRPLRKSQRRAAALNRIYSTDLAEPCHYIYFTQHHSEWLPLVAAIARIIGAENDQKQYLVQRSCRLDRIHILDKIIQTSTDVISPLHDSVLKEKVCEKLQHLRVALSQMHHDQLAPTVSLGKRKYGQLEDEY